MDKQKQLDARMRMILIEWIIDVVAEFKLSQTTLHLVVSILDRVLSNIECPRTKFQLVGATCVFIAGFDTNILFINTIWLLLQEIRGHGSGVGGRLRLHNEQTIHAVGRKKKSKKTRFFKKN